MKEENPQDFKFDVDEGEDPEFIFQEELKELRIEKLSQRVTMLTVLLPILVAFILYIGYRDVTGRLSQSRDSVSIQDQKLETEIEQLSKNLESQTTEVKAQIQGLETSLATKLSSVRDQNAAANEKQLSELKQKIAAVEQTTQSVHENVQKTENDLRKTMTSKADMTEIAPIQKEIKELKTLHQNIVTITSDVKKVESDMNSKLSEIGAFENSTRQNIAQLQSSIDKISNQKIDQEDLEVELLMVRKKYQQIIDAAIVEIQKQLDSIRRDIKELENFVASKKSLSSTTKVAPPATAGSPSMPTTSRGFKEQDIPE